LQKTKVQALGSRKDEPSIIVAQGQEAAVAATVVELCPSMASLHVWPMRMPDKTDAKIITASPLENWRRPLECSHTTWLKTIQQDLKSKSANMKIYLLKLHIFLLHFQHNANLFIHT